MRTWDVAVVGGGILGTSVAYWLGTRYDGAVAVVEQERAVALHTSRRNTGVVHRPFYLNPQDARVFARTAGVSYHLWKSFARERQLPWAEVGTLDVATTEAEAKRLDLYAQWAPANGMKSEEYAVLDPKEVHRIEPEVRCAGAFWSKTDTSVDFQAFTEALRLDAEAAGVSFLTGSAVERVEPASDDLILHRRGGEPVRTRFLINCAGGHSLALAHAMEIGREYADLHFRGEYWVVASRRAGLAGRNLYSVPRNPELPFLDPHWIVRANGRREIGPNAVPVPGPWSYDDRLIRLAPWLERFYEPPARNKARLLFQRDFLLLAAREMGSSLSKGGMVRRVQRFLPGLHERDVAERGTAGVRSQVVDRHGRMLREAVELAGPNSLHVVNYNSPGATGAPAYAALLVDRLAAGGQLDHLKPAKELGGPWRWEALAGPLGLSA